MTAPVALHAPSDTRDAAGPAVTRREVDLVYSAALRRTGDRHVAEDVTQAVFVVFAQRRAAAAKAAQRAGGLSGWLLATTRHVAANARRRRVRRDYHERRAATMKTADAAIASSDPTEAISWGEVAPLLDDAVLSLSAADRTAIVLRYYEDRPATEIAQILGCSHEAARQRLSRALARLKKKLDRQGVALPASVLAATLAAQAVKAAPMTLSQSCLAITAGAVAPAAAVSLATGGSMLAPMMMKGAAAIGIAGVVTAVGFGLGGNGPQGSQATVAPPGAAATQPATQPTTPDALAAAAAIDAANLPPSEEVIERVLVPSEQGKHEIDLDTGRTYGPADYETVNEPVETAVDAALGRSPMTPGLRGFGLVARPVLDSAWELEPAAPELSELWAHAPEGEWLDAIGPLPRTFMFRTTEGAGGVLQLLERLETARGEAEGIRLRYKVLVRGEGPSVREQIQAQEEVTDRRGGWTEGDAQLGKRIRQALQAMFHSKMETGQWPDDLEAAREFAGDAWPEGLPETLTYAPPKRDPASPRPPLPVLFEDDRFPEPTPEDPEPAVVVGFEDGHAELAHSEEALNDFLRRAGFPVPEDDPQDDAAAAIAPEDLFEAIAQRKDPQRRAAGLASALKYLADGTAAERTATLVAVRQAGDVPFDRAPLLAEARKLLQAEDAGVVHAALMALPVLGATADDAERIAKLADHPSPQVRSAVAFSLNFSAGGERRGELPQKAKAASNAAVLKLLDAEEPEVVRETLRSLWGFEVSPEVEAKVIELSRVPDDEKGPIPPQGTYADAMYFALSTRPLVRPAVARRLIEIMQDPRMDAYNVRARAAWGLSHHSLDPAIVDEVVAAFAEELEATLSPQVRENVIYGLKRLDTPAAREALAKVEPEN